MYSQFTPKNNESYQLKQQGIVSTVIISAAFLAGGGLALKGYLDNPGNRGLLFSTIVLLGLAAFLLLKQLSFKLIVDTNKKTFTHSRLGRTREFKFEEYLGPGFTKVKGAFGITQGNSLHLDFEQNGKEKRAMIAQNISQKKVRTITEEINQLINA